MGKKKPVFDRSAKFYCISGTLFGSRSLFQAVSLLAHFQEARLARLRAARPAHVDRAVAVQVDSLRVVVLQVGVGVINQGGVEHLFQNAFPDQLVPQGVGEQSVLLVRVEARCDAGGEAACSSICRLFFYVLEDLAQPELALGFPHLDGLALEVRAEDVLFLVPGGD